MYTCKSTEAVEGRTETQDPILAMIQRKGRTEIQNPSTHIPMWKQRHYKGKNRNPKPYITHDFEKGKNRNYEGKNRNPKPYITLCYP